MATDRITLVPGKPTDVDVIVERIYGHSNDIELFVERLPEGVTALTTTGSDKPVSKGGKGAKGAKTTKGQSLALKLTAEKGPFSGHIRILAKDKDGDGPVRTGRATVAALGVLTEDFWLTIGK